MAEQCSHSQPGKKETIHFSKERKVCADALEKIFLVFRFGIQFTGLPGGQTDIVLQGCSLSASIRNFCCP